MSVILNVVGIVLNIFGVVLIFLYGISPFVSKDGFIRIYTHKELNDANSPPNRRKKAYWVLARVGLSFCIAGSLLQIASAFLQ